MDPCRRIICIPENSIWAPSLGTPGRPRTSPNGRNSGTCGGRLSSPKGRCKDRRRERKGQAPRGGDHKADRGARGRSGGWNDSAAPCRDDAVQRMGQSVPPGPVVASARSEAKMRWISSATSGCSMKALRRIPLPAVRAKPGICLVHLFDESRPLRIAWPACPGQGDLAYLLWHRARGFEPPPSAPLGEGESDEASNWPLARHSRFLPTVAILNDTSPSRGLHPLSPTCSWQIRSAGAYGDPPADAPPFRRAHI